LRLRVQVWKDLEIVDENVDVKALAMFDLEHQGRSAAEAPSIQQREF